jgi:hypothetical protein
MNAMARREPRQFDPIEDKGASITMFAGCYRTKAKLTHPPGPSGHPFRSSGDSLLSSTMQFEKDMEPSFNHLHVSMTLLNYNVKVETNMVLMLPSQPRLPYHPCHIAPGHLPTGSHEIRCALDLGHVVCVIANHQRIWPKAQYLDAYEPQLE